jgi:hypothetical protein
MSKENSQLKKYADKIRTIAKESSLDENTPDKYLLLVADAVEKNKFQLSAAIEAIINTRKDLFELQKNIIIDIVDLKNKVSSFDDAIKGVEQNVNATTLFHQNMTDLLIAYFGVPKQKGEGESEAMTESDKRFIQEQEQVDIPEIGEVEVPEIQDSEEQVSKEEQVPEEQVQAKIISSNEEAVREFKPKGKKK